MHESRCDNELRLSILVRNANKLFWSSTDNVSLIVYPMKFVFNCLSYSGWISSGTNRFGFNSVWVISDSDLHRVNKSSSQFGFDSGHIGFWVITVSGRFGFGSVQFRISDRNWFNSFSRRFGSDFELFGSGRLVRVIFIRSTRQG